MFAAYLLLGICLASSFTLCSHLPLTWSLCLSLLLITMSVYRTESRHKNVSTTIIRCKSSTESPLVTLQSITAQVGIRHTKSCSKLARSPAHLSASASASASPAPSSISNYSQEPGPSNVDWDIPATFPSNDIPISSGRKRCIRVRDTKLPSPLLLTFMSCLQGETNECMDSLDLILPGWDHL